MTDTTMEKAVAAVYALEYGAVSFTCEEMVRAVLTAIREPDEATLKIGRHDDMTFAEIWTAQIDAILKEGT